jgi:hypothetical protein
LGTALIRHLRRWLPDRQMVVVAASTYVDTLAFVRQQRWPVTLSYMSPAKPDIIEIPRALFQRFTDTRAFVA